MPVQFTKPTMSLLLAPAASVYGFSKTPPFVGHYYMGDVATSPAASHNGTRAIASAGILCNAPSALVGDVTPTAFSADSTDTANALYAGYADNKIKANGLRPLLTYYPNTEEDATSLSSNAVKYVQTKLQYGAGAPFYGHLEVGTVPSQELPDGTLRTDQLHIIEMGVGAPVPGYLQDGVTLDLSGGTPFRIILQEGQPPRLQQPQVINSAWQYSDNFGDNSIVSDLSGVQCDQILATNARTYDVEILPISNANVLIVSITGIVEPLVFRGSQTTGFPLMVAAGYVRISWRHGMLGMALWPMRFQPNGTFTSGTIDEGFPYPGNGIVIPSEASQPPGTSITTDLFQSDDDDPTQLKYSVTFTAEPDESGLASATPFIRSVGLYVPQTTTYNTIDGGNLDLSNYISSVSMHSYYDRDTGTMQRQCGINLSNADGFFTGPLAGINYAVQFSINLNYKNADGNIVALSIPLVQMTGWTGHKQTSMRSDPKRRFDLVLDDRIWQLEDTPLIAPLFGDGWCIRAFIHLLLNLAGISDEWIGDELKTCDFGPNPSGCPHFKLPIGTGLHPRVAYMPGTPTQQIINDIAQYEFAVFWADVMGIFHYSTYYDILAAAPYRCRFTTDGGESDGFSTDDPDQALTQISGGSGGYSVDTDYHRQAQRNCFNRARCTNRASCRLP